MVFSFPCILTSLFSFILSMSLTCLSLRLCFAHFLAEVLYVYCFAAALKVEDHFNFYSFLQFVAATQPINSLAFVFDGLHYGASDFAYAAYSMVCKHELFCNLVISS